MTSVPTKRSADRIVRELAVGLSRLRREELPSVRSVYLTGSYIRGDWLDATSDLDVTVLYGPTEPGRGSADLQTIQAIIGVSAVPAPFASQCPGSVDWSTQPAVPTTPAEARAVGPYLHHSIFLFDLAVNHRVLWGEDIGQILPPPPDPKELSAEALRFLAARVADLGTDEESSRRAAFAAYKAVLIAQLHFGERTLSKVRILDLYQQCVPEFSEKHLGEIIVRDYLGSYYPDRPPTYQPASHYRAFVQSLCRLMPTGFMRH